MKRQWYELKGHPKYKCFILPSEIFSEDTVYISIHHRTTGEYFDKMWFRKDRLIPIETLPRLANNGFAKFQRSLVARNL